LVVLNGELGEVAGFFAFFCFFGESQDVVDDFHV